MSDPTPSPLMLGFSKSRLKPQSQLPLSQPPSEPSTSTSTPLQSPSDVKTLSSSARGIAKFLRPVDHDKLFKEYVDTPVQHFQPSKRPRESQQHFQLNSQPQQHFQSQSRYQQPQPVPSRSIDDYSPFDDIDNLVQHALDTNQIDSSVGSEQMINDRYIPTSVTEIPQYQDQLRAMKTYFDSLVRMPTKGALPKGGLILQGPAGCGKSTFTRLALCSLGFEIIEINGIDCYSKSREAGIQSDLVKLEVAIANAITVSASGMPHVLLVDALEGMSPLGQKLINKVILQNWNILRSRRYKNKLPDGHPKRIVRIVSTIGCFDEHQLTHVQTINLDGYSYDNVVKLVRRIAVTTLGVQQQYEKVTINGIERSTSGMHVLAARQFPESVFFVGNASTTVDTNKQCNLWKVLQDIQIMVTTHPTVWTISDVQKTLMSVSDACDARRSIGKYVTNACANKMREIHTQGSPARYACDFMFENIHTIGQMMQPKIGQSVTLDMLVKSLDMITHMDMIAATQFPGSFSYSGSIDWELVPHVITEYPAEYVRKQTGQRNTIRDALPLKGAYPRHIKSEPWLLEVNASRAMAPLKYMKDRDPDDVVEQDYLMGCVTHLTEGVRRNWPKCI